MNLKIWIKETRPQFLLLSLALVLLGTSVACSDGYFNPIKFILTAAGLLLAHASVNVLNDYFDFKSGIDAQTTPTSFSGGSGILTKGLLKPESVCRFGLVTLAIAFFIGIYLTIYSGWQLLVLIFIGGLVIFFYTPFLTKWLIGELWAGLGLGTLPVIGTYFVQTGSLSLEILIVSLVPGFLTANLLLLNEFPDLEADRKGGRYHLVIALGRKKAAVVYAGIMLLTYGCITGGVISKIMPYHALLALLTIIFALKAVIITFSNNNNLEKMIAALRFNVITVLGTDVFLAFGYFIDFVMQ
ncbi:MAG: prenyltransferase [Sedimentisphaerales bacterium]|nr:prenyltransferase [Sedimentisphaerales bacterium]